MEWLSNPQIWISLLTLTLLEIVLGIDNIIFISILSGKLPPEQQAKARKLGLGLALFTRVLLLMGLAWVVKLDRPFFEHESFGFKLAVSVKDLILITGGLFLIYKSVHEIHEKLEGEDGEKTKKITPAFGQVIFSILMMDIIFSLDSVITAVGMADHIMVMIIAVMISVGFMMVFAGSVSDFISAHPTVKMLALSFLLLIGTTLIAEGFHVHFEKGYVYFAMAFSIFVEMLNIRVKKRAAAKAALAK